MQLSMFPSGLPQFLLLSMNDSSTCWPDVNMLITLPPNIPGLSEEKNALGNSPDPYQQRD